MTNTAMQTNVKDFQTTTVRAKPRPRNFLAVRIKGKGCMTSFQITLGSIRA